MGSKMEVWLGTLNTLRFNIDLDDYDGCAQSRKAVDEDDIETAYSLLKNVLNDGPYFTADHYRNNHAVNACIGLHVMGYDPEAWFDSFFEKHNRIFRDVDIELFKEHVERIAPYCQKWGPNGREGWALSYAV